MSCVRDLYHELILSELISAWYMDTPFRKAIHYNFEWSHAIELIHLVGNNVMQILPIVRSFYLPDDRIGIGLNL